MIFITVGTDNHDFSRLVRAADSLNTREKIIVQRGHTKHIPKAESFTFTSNKRIEELYSKADIIITHAGAGSIINSLKNGKVPIVVPRLRIHGEHVNDHQLDLAKHLASSGKAVLVEDVNDLQNAIKKSKRASPSKPELAKKLSEYLKEEAWKRA